MSDFQIALIFLGVALVIAVWFYNRRVEKQHRQRAAQMLPTAMDDVLKMREPAKTEPDIFPLLKEEPVISTTAAPESPQALLPETLPPELTVTEPERAPDSVMVSSPDPVKPGVGHEAEEDGNHTGWIPVPDEWGDGRVDCLLCVEFSAPEPVPELRKEYREWSSRIDKPIQWLGLDGRTGRWHTLFPQDSSSVKHLAVALQLVDRRGAVSEASLQTFIDGTSRLAQGFAGRVEVPPMATLLERAQELDAFCASVDLQLSVHILPRNTPHLSGALLGPLLDQSGLKLEGERFVATDESGAEAFALICRSATSFPAERVAAMELIDLIFSLDVPRVAAGAQTFDRMIAFARQCATALGGQLADAHRKPLPDATLATIRRRIDELQNRMAERGIAAGGVRALRLFA